MTHFNRRLSRLFGADNRCLVVALDHAGFMDKPLRGLESPGEVLRQTASAGADAFLVTPGSASRYSENMGRAGLWLSVDTAPVLAERVVKEALRLGADGLKCMVYPNWDARPNSVADFFALALACREWNLPIMAEVIPGGFMAGPDMRAPEIIAAGARVAFEAGADVIKTIYTGSPESFAKVKAYCPAPIIVLGGERAKDDYTVLQSVRDAMDAGAAGVAIGRNVWQHPHPGKMTAALSTLAHGDTSVDDALIKLHDQG